MIFFFVVTFFFFFAVFLKLSKYGNFVVDETKKAAISELEGPPDSCTVFLGL